MVLGRRAESTGAHALVEGVLNRFGGSRRKPLPQKLGNNRGSQAEPPAPPKEILCFEWWGRRFLLPSPIAGDFFTAPKRAGTSRLSTLAEAQACYEINPVLGSRHYRA